MISYKRILKILAKNHGIDPDILLIALWDSSSRRFEYLKNHNSIIKDKDYIFVKKNIIPKLKLGSGRINKKPEFENEQLVYKDFDFSTVGKIVSPIHYISRNEIEKIYEELVTDFQESSEDPISPVGIKNENMLDSAIFHPMTSYEDVYKYPTVQTAAAALMYSISHNHAFHNGNKRTALVAMLVFLDRHSISLNCTEDELFKLSLRLADHKLVDKKYMYSDAEVYELAKWIDLKSKVMRKGERPITLKKLRQILSYFDCEILPNGKVVRNVLKKALFGTTKTVSIRSKSTIGNTITEGQEVDKGLIKSLREELELNADNGIDSDAFYEEDAYTSSEFIIKYKNLLKRLAKL